MAKLMVQRKYYLSHLPNESAGAMTHDVMDATTQNRKWQAEVVPAHIYSVISFLLGPWTACLWLFFLDSILHSSADLLINLHNL